MKTEAHSSEQDVLAERDRIEQKIADGDLCSKDGEPCEFENVYGDDVSTGGHRIVGLECRKCGEPPRE